MAPWSGPFKGHKPLVSVGGFDHIIFNDVHHDTLFIRYELPTAIPSFSDSNGRGKLGQAKGHDRGVNMLCLVHARLLLIGESETPPSAFIVQ